MPFEVNGCDPKRLVPIGGPLLEALECVDVVRRGLAWSGACLLNRLARVKCGLYTFEEEMAEQFYKMTSSRWAGSWVAMTDPRSCIWLFIVMSRHLRGSSALGCLFCVGLMALSS